MELGSKVIFRRVARKLKDYVDYQNLTNQQADELEENDFINLDRLEIVELKNTQEGLIVGKRKMKQRTTLEYRENDYSDGLVATGTVSIDVYVVATNMFRTYKVPIDEVEII